jgi:hypothetical protein
MNPHEEGAVKSFIEPTRQERFLDFLAAPKKRKKFTDELSHRRDRFLISKFLKSIPPSQQNAASLYVLLKQLGAPDLCWVICQGELDGQEVELLGALQEVVGRGAGTIISCVPGRLAYFESEEERLILQR